MRLHHKKKPHVPEPAVRLSQTGQKYGTYRTKKLLLILAMCFILPRQANLLTLDINSPELNIGDALAVTVTTTNVDQFSTLGFEIEYDQVSFLSRLTRLAVN